MSFFEEIEKENEKIKEILPEKYICFTDELVEIQLEAIHKTLKSAEKHDIDRSEAVGALVSGIQGAYAIFNFNDYEFLKCPAENTCKDTECPFYCEKQDCVAKEGCGGYTPEENASWKDRMMEHFVKGE